MAGVDKQRFASISCIGWMKCQFEALAHFPRHALVYYIMSHPACNADQVNWLIKEFNVLSAGLRERQNVCNSDVELCV